MARTVLVADDEVDIAQTLAETLEGEGYAALVAHDGVEALAILERHEADLLLTDHLMPRLTGLALIDHLHRHPALAVPVILMSAVTPLPLPPPTTTFLPKPFDLDELLDLVAALLPAR
jgi:CheY-like chemotaxis protein